MKLTGGFPTISDYKRAVQSKLFAEMEGFSDDFLENNRNQLSRYARHWVRDPLHQWSRQWEYQYVFRQLSTQLQGLGHAPKILDAGSGATFFPYFILSQRQNAEVTCCDNDHSLSRIHEGIGRKLERTPRFEVQDLADLSFPSDSFDVVYCISVLEHLSNAGKAIEEFHRILRPNGLLILTFDISIDGRSDIPVDRANALIDLLSGRFSPHDTFPLDISGESFGDTRLVTTDYFRNGAANLLPWTVSNHILSAVRSALALKLPRSSFKRLSFFCCTFSK